ncbi:MAG: BamA/TamA family outer membrane protein [Bacteroidetes bacterium]|nr:BamA/TamA family outer membrane protein [Bacteroidota bacterium]
MSLAKHAAILSIVLIGITWQSCQFPKLLKDNEYLLDNNKIKVNNSKLKEGLLVNIKQKPNRKILSTFKFHLTVYRIGSTFKKANRFSTFLTNKVGEPPAILDSLLCDQSVKQLQIYLRNNGFYQSKVSYTVKNITVKKVLKLATVTYNIETGPALTNADVVYSIEDSSIKELLTRYWKDSYIRTYEPFYTDRYIAERERLTNIIRNDGYYQFSKDYITYEVDSVNDKAHIKMIVRNPAENLPHARFTIGSVMVHIDSFSTGISSDKVIYFKGVGYKKNGYKLNEELLSRGIRITPGMYYKQDSVEDTYASLVQIQLFKYVNIKFELQDSGNHILNCIINLSPRAKQDITWEPTLSVADQPNASGISNQPYRNYGIANVFSYTNNNLLNKADIFKARLRNTFEVQFRENNKIYKNFINSSSFSFINYKNLNSKTTLVIRYTPIEVAGNILNLAIQKADTPTNIKTIFGVRFFTYVKTDLDARLNYNFNSKIRAALRFFGGVGLPYGNSNIMPYEKRYFSGGSNSMRGWRPRTLGPGSYNDVANTLNRTGDMKLEANAEFRFPIPLYKNYFEGAVFADAGNIWNIYKDNSYPDAEFNLSRLKDDIAIDAGFGLRLIFPFFIVRADAAVPIRNPELVKGSRYIYKTYNTVNGLISAVNLSFGIGYPF